MVARGDVRTQGTQAPLLLCTGSATHVASLNSEWERVLGWSREELMSRPIADFVHPNDRERTLAEAAKVGLAGYEVASFENRFRARGGQWRRLRWSARADGHRWIAVAVDVTDEQPPETSSPAQSVPWPAASTPAPRSPAPPAAALPASAPAAPWSAPSRLFDGTRAAGIGAVLACLALLIAVHGIGNSSALRPPRQAQILPHMFGPLNGAGPAYTLRRVASSPPDMLGPRRVAIGPMPGPGTR